MDIILVLNENIYIQISIYFYVSHNYIFYFLFPLYVSIMRCVFRYFSLCVPLFCFLCSFLFFNLLFRARERDCITRNESSREGA